MEKRQQPNLHRSITLARSQRYQLTAFTKPMTKPVESAVQKPELAQTYNQESADIGERLKGCFPADIKTFLFSLVTIVYLIAAMMHFLGWSGDNTMLNTIIGVMGGYNGLTEVKALVPWGKE